MLSPRAQQNLEHPSESTYRSVVGVNLCCAMVAMMIVAMFLNSLRKDELERFDLYYEPIETIKQGCQEHLFQNQQKLTSKIRF
jgi:hypothetical protein